MRVSPWYDTVVMPYTDGITLEKVDLDLSGAHHDIRSSRPQRLSSLGADQLLRCSSLEFELSA